MSHTNYNIILYKLLTKYFVCNNIVMSYCDVKHMFIGYNVIPNVCPYIIYKCSYSVGNMTTQNS